MKLLPAKRLLVLEIILRNLLDNWLRKKITILFKKKKKFTSKICLILSLYLIFKSCSVGRIKTFFPPLKCKIMSTIVAIKLVPQLLK